jgi:cell division protein FtsI (penicillin-binding protein 3)
MARVRNARPGPRWLAWPRRTPGRTRSYGSLTRSFSCPQIARDLPVSDLYAAPAVFWDTKEAARDLAKATGASEERLNASFEPKKGYVLVQRGLTPDKRDAVMRLGYPGLTFEKAYKRYYPSGRIVAHAVGQVDPDDNGISGLELGLNETVRHTDEPVALSLDMRVQYVLEHEMEETSRAFRQASAGIVLDVHSGEVLALASLPDYEPNQRNHDKGDSTRNRMTQDVYELGSIFKIFAFSEAVEEKTVRLDEPIDVGHPYKLGRYLIHDFEKLGPYLPASMVFAESSNIGTAQIALRSGPAKQQPFLQKLGLLAPLKTELPERLSRRWGVSRRCHHRLRSNLRQSDGFAAAAAAVVTAEL